MGSDMDQYVHVSPEDFFQPGYTPLLNYEVNVRFLWSGNVNS